MTLSDHSADDICPTCGCVDSTLANIDSSNKECSLETVLRKLVKNPIGVDVWSVVVSDGDSSSLLASVNASSSVLDIALLRASIIASAGTTRRLVGVTTGAEVN